MHVLSFWMNSISDGFGAPVTSNILTNWSFSLTCENIEWLSSSIFGEKGKHESPWNNTWASLFYMTLAISPMMQPIPQTSICSSYWSWQTMISGARYHLDCIAGERLLFLDSKTYLCESRLWTLSCYIFDSSFEPWTPWLVKSWIDLQCVGTVIVCESPKSHSFIWQSLVTKMLPGFISLCMILAEWRKWRAHNKLYRIIVMCSSEKFLTLRTLMRS